MKKKYGDMIIKDEFAGTTSGRVLLVRCTVCGIEREVNKYTFLTKGRGHSHEKSCHIELKKLVNHPLYDKFSRTFTAMQSRCNYPSNGAYKDYGAKGIKVEFRDLVDFYEHMWESYLAHCDKHGGDNTTIERVDLKGNYSAENCIWATARDQAVNRSNRKTVMATRVDDGHSEYVDDLAQFIRDNNLTPSVVYRIIDNPIRTNKGWKFTSANGES